MTIYGIDISHWQSGLDLGAVRAQGYEFVAIKCTEGGGYSDPAYPRFLAEARDAGLLVAAYHFLRSDTAINAQADNIAANIGDKTIPVMIDCEPTGASKPNLRHASALRAALATRGIAAPSLYLPHFWWTAIGSPNLAKTDFTLWQALYGKNPAGYGSALYPGDTSTRWNKQGGVAPTILQFGSRGVIDGFTGSVDVDAFRGTRDELIASGLFKDYAKVAPSKPGRATLVRALGSNATHTADLNAIPRKRGSVFDFRIRAALWALAAERRAIEKRVGK